MMLYAPPTKTIYDNEGYVTSLREEKQSSTDEHYTAFLLLEIEKTKTLFYNECKELAKRKDDLTYWTGKAIQDLEKRLNLLNREVKIYLGKEKNISPETIAKAREYPIENLIKTTRGMAKCPFHNDKTPSLNVRNNFYYCHGCSTQGDVIDLYMHLNHCSFKQAVTALCG